MNMLNQIALETAVKRSLLAISEEVERLQVIDPDAGKYFDQALPVLERIASERGYLGNEAFKLYDSGEGLFFLMVLRTTRDQMLFDPDFWDSDHLRIIVDLVGQWVFSLCGNPDKMVGGPPLEQGRVLN